MLNGFTGEARLNHLEIRTLADAMRGGDMPWEANQPSTQKPREYRKTKD
jgi:hypothetical protein